MFGFLRHCRNDTDYQRAYRRCCQFQHIEYGVPSLAFLSYEAVFLYQLGMDAGLVAAEELTESKPISKRKCCRLQASRRMLNDADAWLARFATSFGVLLGKIKIDDDIRDSGSLAARFASRALRRKHNKAIEYFQSLDDRFTSRVEEVLDDHHKLEQSTTTHSIKQYSKPTGRAFGYLFQLLGEAARRNNIDASNFNRIARPIGQLVGESIIAFDCAVDYERDKRTGDYNPLGNECDVRDSLHYCTSQLSIAGNLISKTMGASQSGLPLPTQRVLAGRVKSLQRRFHFLGDCLGGTLMMTNVKDAADGVQKLATNDDDDGKHRWYDCFGDCCCDSCGQGGMECACSGCEKKVESLECCNAGGDAAGETVGGCCEGADCCSGCDCGC